MTQPENARPPTIDGAYRSRDDSTISHTSVSTPPPSPENHAQFTVTIRPQTPPTNDRQTAITPRRKPGPPTLPVLFQNGTQITSRDSTPRPLESPPPSCPPSPGGSGDEDPSEDDDPPFTPPPKQPYSSQALYRACQQHPEILALDIHWANGQWFQGHPSERTQLKDIHTSHLPSPPLRPRMGSIFTKLPTQPTRIVLFRTQLELLHGPRHVASLNIWCHQNTWLEGGPNGPPMQQRPGWPTPPPIEKYVGPLYPTSTQTIHVAQTAEPDKTPLEEEALRTPRSMGDDEPYHSPKTDTTPEGTTDMDLNTNCEDSPPPNLRTTTAPQLPVPQQTECEIIPPEQQKWGSAKDQPRFQCLIKGCAAHNPTYGESDRNKALTPKGLLIAHLRNKHNVSSIPAGACTPFGIFQCPEPSCRRIYAHPNGVAQHHRTVHTLSNTTPSTPRSRDNPTVAIPVTEPTTQPTGFSTDMLKPTIQYSTIIEKNERHLHWLLSHPDQIMETQGGAPPALPTSIAILMDAFYAEIFSQMNRDLDNPLPPVMLAASTRYLLAPPPGGSSMASWPTIVENRMRRLAQGEGDRLWNEHDWKAQFTVSNTIKRITPDQVHSVMQKGLAAQHPARTFKRLTSIPFCPPTARVADILQTKVNSRPNPDTEWIHQQAARHLPSKPYGRINSPEGKDAHDITKHWARIIDRSNPQGAPGCDQHKRKTQCVHETGAK